MLDLPSILSFANIRPIHFGFFKVKLRLQDRQRNRCFVNCFFRSPTIYFPKRFVASDKQCLQRIFLMLQAILAESYLLLEEDIFIIRL